MKLATDVDEISLTTDAVSVATTIDSSQCGSTFDHATKSFAPDARTMEMLPQLVGHTWQDSYFDKRDDKHEILAVFDHRRWQFCGLYMIGLLFSLGLFLPFALITVSVWKVDKGEGLVLTRLLFTALLLYSTWMLYKAVCSALPRTAVTLEGMLHVDIYRITYFVPWNDIVRIRSGLKDETHAHSSVLLLERVVTEYQTPKKFHCCPGYKLIIMFLKEQELFQAVVERMVMLTEQEDDLEIAFPALTNTLV
ncbi:hypothetical protein MPSEU_000108700 [Mayamaea pseudoterrestris]|nr:hypothetical protein MPSEU_000108700 [Mayamaea pseudoterrestris]